VDQTAHFEFGVKAVNVQEDDDGTLHIEGIAADFQTDRDLEAFEPDAFEQGLKGFMENPVLLYHHDPKLQLGLVTVAQIDGKSLRIRADFPKPPESAGTAMQAYNLVKRGMMRGFSVGGSFFRHMTSSGPKIHQADLQEISITPLPVNPRTLFGVAGKAFGTAAEPELDARLSDLEVVFEAIGRRAAA
jgi:HK97 family phage prohead protease